MKLDPSSFCFCKWHRATTCDFEQPWPRFASHKWNDLEHVFLSSIIWKMNINNSVLIWWLWEFNDKALYTEPDLQEASYNSTYDECHLWATVFMCACWSRCAGVSGSGIADPSVWIFQTGDYHWLSLYRIVLVYTAIKTPYFIMTLEVEIFNNIYHSMRQKVTRYCSILCLVFSTCQVFIGNLHFLFSEACLFGVGGSFSPVL